MKRRKIELVSRIARPLTPILEEEENEEDQIYEQRNKRMLIDVTSEKTNGKVPAGLTDPSADRMFDEELDRKTIKLPVNHPRSSSTFSSALDKEPPKRTMKLALWDSSSLRKVGPRSSTCGPYIRRELGHVKSGSAAGSGSTDGNALWDDLRILGYGSLLRVEGAFEPLWGTFEPLFGAKKAFNEVPQLPGKVGTLLKKCVEKCQTELKTNKKDSFSKKSKWNSRWLNIEDMLLSLTDLPEMQMEAVCALYRQEMKTHEQTTSRIFSDLQYAKLKQIVEFLTAGNVHGPCRKTSEELEEIFRGGTSYCSWLVCTYSSELYSIYRGGLDMHFS